MTDPAIVLRNAQEVQPGWVISYGEFDTTYLVLTARNGSSVFFHLAITKADDEHLDHRSYGFLEAFHPDDPVRVHGKMALASIEADVEEVRTLQDVRERLTTADERLLARAAEIHECRKVGATTDDPYRVEGKAEGVRLARSYVDEALTLAGAEG